MGEEHTPAMLAEMAGGSIACQMIDLVFASTSQEEAIRAIMAGLKDAFNPDDDATITAVAGGFAAVVVNVLERGCDAIKTDGADFVGGESE
jgi:hypothetical protein